MRTVIVPALFVCGTLFAGCATGPTFTAGRTTLHQMTEKLGDPYARLPLGTEVTRVRWVRTTFHGADSAGNRYDMPETFYDGEFRSGNVLRRWRAVDKSVALWESFGFDLPATTWSSGYVQHADGGTPLHYAASEGQKDVAESLLANNAEVNAKNRYGARPLHMAVANGHKDAAEILLAHGADVNAVNNSKQTPLHQAAGGGYKDVVQILLANKAEVNAKANNGSTPLHWAAMYDRKDVVELLFANGADVNAKDRNGDTPLHLAVLRGNNDVAGLLRQHGGHE